MERRPKRLLKTCGYDTLAKRYGVALVDAQKEKSVTVDCKGMELHLCNCALQVDYMINVPVMKGHCQTRITCALKNMKGLSAQYGEKAVSYDGAS